MSSTNHPLTPPSSNKGGSNKSSTTMIMHTDPNQWYRCTGDIHDFHAEVSSPSPLSSHHHHYQSHHHHAGGAFLNHNNMYDPNNNGRLMMMSLPMIPNVTTPTTTATAMAVVPPPQTISSSVVSSSSTTKASSKSKSKSKNNNKSKQQSNNNANATKPPRPRILKLDKYESLPEHTVILGRGRESKENPGNIKLHTLALMYLDEYSMAEKNKNMKSKLVKQIVQLVENNSCSTTDKNNIPGFVKRNKNGEWEEVSYAAAREKVGYTFRDLLADRYRSSSKSKVARLRASRATITSTSSLEQPDGAPTSDGGINVVVSSTSSPKPLLEDDAPSVTTTTTPNKPCESDENPLEWRDDPNNVSLKSVFDEVLFAGGVDMNNDEETSSSRTTAPKKKKKTNKKRKGGASLIKPLSVQSSSFLNAAASSVFLSSDISTDPIKLSEFEHVFCQVFGERLVAATTAAAAPIAAAAASSPATRTTTTKASAVEPLPSATARLRPRKRRAVCNFIVRSGEKNSM